MELSDTTSIVCDGQPTQEDCTSQSMPSVVLKAACEGAVVKFLVQQRRKRTRMNGRESQRKGSVTDAYLGGVASYRCSAVAIGRCG